MSYILSGLKVAVPARASRPREPARPAPGKVLTSPALASRMLRPRTPTDPGRAAPHIDKVKALKLQQAACERQLAAMQKALANCRDPKTCLGLKKNIAVLVERIKSLAGQANKEALAAVDKGASPAVVQDVAKAADPSSSVTPVVEASTAELRPDGTVAVSADAQITDVPVTSDPGSSTVVTSSVAAGDSIDAVDGESSGLSLPVMVGAGLGVLFLLSRLK